MFFSYIILVAFCLFFILFPLLWHVAGKSLRGGLCSCFRLVRKSFASYLLQKLFALPKTFLRSALFFCSLSSLSSLSPPLSLYLSRFLFLRCGAGKPQKIIKIHSFDLQAELSGAADFPSTRRCSGRLPFCASAKQQRGKGAKGKGCQGKHTHTRTQIERRGKTFTTNCSRIN